MRVVHVISSFRPVIGGAERATETLAKALREQGVEARVLTRRYAADHPPRENIAGIPVRRVGLATRSKLGALSFALGSAALLTARSRWYDIIHVQNIDTPLLVGILAKVVTRRPLVATIHGESPILGRLLSRTGRIRLRLMVRYVDAFSSIGEQVAEELRGIGVPPERIFPIPNGIDTSVYRVPGDAERSAARAALGVGKDEAMVLYLGRLAPFKRVDLLIDAWSTLRTAGARLWVVGDGELAQALREQAAPLGSSVVLEGPTDDALRYLHAADVFVNASGDARIQGYEGLSVALLEAMACGLAVVVTRGPGNDILVEDGQTGLSFEMGDRDGLAGRLEQTIESPELRADLGRAAAERVVSSYSAARVARSVSDMYQEVDPNAFRKGPEER